MVVDLLAARLLGLDDLRVETRFGKAEQGVDPGEPRQAEPDLLVGLVQGPALVQRELPPAVVAAAHMVVPVHLEDVAVGLVHDQPADDELVVVAEVAQVRRVAAVGDQPVQRHAERQLLDLSQGIHGERVVHVEPHHRDLVHLQPAVRVDLPAVGQLDAQVLRTLEQTLDFGVPQNVQNGGRGALRDRHAGRSMIPPTPWACKHFAPVRADRGGGRPLTGRPARTWR